MFLCKGWFWFKFEEAFFCLLDLMWLILELSVEVEQANGLQSISKCVVRIPNLDAQQCCKAMVLAENGPRVVLGVPNPPYSTEINHSLKINSFLQAQPFDVCVYALSNKDGFFREALAQHLHRLCEVHPVLLQYLRRQPRERRQV